MCDWRGTDEVSRAWGSVTIKNNCMPFPSCTLLIMSGWHCWSHMAARVWERNRRSDKTQPPSWLASPPFGVALTGSLVLITFPGAFGEVVGGKTEGGHLHGWLVDRLPLPGKHQLSRTLSCWTTPELTHSTRTYTSINVFISIWLNTWRHAVCSSAENCPYSDATGVEMS